MSRYFACLVTLSMGLMLLHASIVNCGWVLGPDSTGEPCGAASVAPLVQTLGAGVTAGAAGALAGLWLGWDRAARRWYEKVRDWVVSRSKGAGQGNEDE